MGSSNSSDAAHRLRDEAAGPATMSLFDLAPELDTAPDWTSAVWVVRPVTQTTAKAWIPQYHYAGTIGTGNATFYGVYCPDMIGMVSVGSTANPYGLKYRYDLERWRGNVEVTRIAVHPDSPKNAASRCLGAVLWQALRKQGIEWCFSYSDTGQGHHGGIYQAVNAVYVGLTTPQAGWLVDGFPVHPRSLVAKYGTSSREKLPPLLEAEGHTWEYVEGLNTAKHTYIMPCGSPSVNRDIRAHLERHRVAYPKRDNPASMGRVA